MVLIKFNEHKSEKHVSVATSEKCPDNISTSDQRGGSTLK